MTNPSARFDPNTGLNVWHWPGAATSTQFLCLHSFGWNGLQWAPVAGQLAGRASVLAPDLPGFGLSEKREQVTYKGVADRLAQWMQAEGSGPRLLVGASWSTWLSLSFAARYPELVSGLVLIDGGFWNPPAWRPGAPLPAVPAFASREEALAFVRREVPDAAWEGELGPCLDLRFREENGQVRLNVEPETMLEYFKAIATAPWREWLAAVRCPVLALSCNLGAPPPALQDKAAGYGAAREVLFTFTLEEYEDRIHLAHLQDPAWFARRILAFATETRRPSRRPGGPR